MGGGGSSVPMGGYGGGSPFGGQMYDPTKNPNYRAISKDPGGFGTGDWRTSHPGFWDKFQQAGPGGFLQNPTFRATSENAGGFGTQAWQAAHPQFDDRWKQVSGGFVQQPQQQQQQYWGGLQQPSYGVPNDIMKWITGGFGNYG